jgi:hypothetical protein
MTKKEENYNTDGDHNTKNYNFFVVVVVEQKHEALLISFLFTELLQ